MLPSPELRPLPRPRSLSTPRREDLLAAFRASERVAWGCVGAELAATVLLLAFAWGRLGTVPAWQSVSLFVAGAVGVFEFPAFEHGTQVIAHAVAESGAFSIAGGGDTLAAIAKYGIEKQIDYISTGGGAFLEVLEGKTLPAFEILNRRAAG